MVTTDAIYEFGLPLTAFGFMIGTVFSNFKRRLPFESIIELEMAGSRGALVLRTEDMQDYYFASGHFHDIVDIVTSLWNDLKPQVRQFWQIFPFHIFFSRRFQQ